MEYVKLFSNKKDISLRCGVVIPYKLLKKRAKKLGKDEFINRLEKAVFNLGGGKLTEFERRRILSIYDNIKDF